MPFKLFSVSDAFTRQVTPSRDTRIALGFENCPTATKVPLPYVTAVKLAYCPRNASRRNQVLPSTELRIVLTAPTVTNTPPPYRMPYKVEVPSPGLLVQLTPSLEVTMLSPLATATNLPLP